MYAICIRHLEFLLVDISLNFWKSHYSYYFVQVVVFVVKKNYIFYGIFSCNIATILTEYVRVIYLYQVPTS